MSGDTIIRGYVNIAGNHIEMDINRLNERMNYPLSLLYRTGPAEFNISMRALCKKKGGKLNENELIVNGSPVEVNSEKDVFDALGLVYQDPSHRTKYLEYARI